MRSVNEIRYLYITMPYNKYCNQKRLLLFLSIVIGITVIGLGIAIGMSANSIKSRGFRLPEALVPKHYNLEIQPFLNPGNFKFVGKVEISFGCVEETDEIVMHAKGLELDESLTSLRDKNDREILISKVYFESDFDLVIIVIQQKLQKENSYKLRLKFKGTLSQGQEGITLSTYEDENKVTHYTAITKFGTHSARKAFPCFDEPAMKATFDIKVVRLVSMVSVSNMPKKTTEIRGDNWKADVFKTTKKISTCYVAFFVGNYRRITRKKDRVTIWVPPHESLSLDYAFNFTNRIISFYEKLLQVPYPLPKLNLISIDEGTTQSSGIITCQTDILSTDVLTDDLTLKDEILTRWLSTQIGIQWFGVLVTPKWWSDIWTSVSFAKFIAEKFASDAVPYLFQETAILSEFKECAINGGDIITLSNVVDTHEDLTEQAFNDMRRLHGTGVDVIEILMYFVNEENFWKSLRAYLNENAYGTTDEDILLSYFDKAQTTQVPPLNVTQMIKSWTHLKGLPILTVKRNYEKREALVEQASCRALLWKQFKNDLWSIPVVISTAKSNKNVESWFSSRNAIIGNMPDRDEWIFINSSYIVNFVNYDRRNWQLLAKQLREDHLVFDSSQRLKLLRDIYTSTITSSIEGDVILDMYLYISHEEEITNLLYAEFFTMIKMYSCLLEKSPVESIWNEYVNSLYVPISQKLGKEEKWIDHIIRSSLQDLFCKMGHANCKDDIQKMFQMWQNAKEGDTELVWFPAVCTAIRYGGNHYWEIVYEEFRRNSFRIEYEALSCSKNIENIQRYLKEYLMLGKAHDEYALVTMQELALYEETWPEFFRFLDENFNIILKNNRFLSFCNWVFDKIIKPDKLEKLISLLRKHINELDVETAKLVQNQITYHEMILSNASKNLQAITKWLRNWHNMKD